MKYTKIVDGKKVVITDINAACENFVLNVKEAVQREKRRNDLLQAENEHLKDTHYENQEIQSLTDQIAELRSMLGYSFRLNKREWDAIHEWQNKHLEEKHNLKSSFDKLTSGGAIGGNWVYKFIPTSVGTIGVCCCEKCGEEFIFQDLF